MGLTSTCKQFEAGSRVPWKPRKVQLEIADWFQKTDPMENQNDQLTQKQEALVSENEMRASNKGEGESEMRLSSSWDLRLNWHLVWLNCH